MVSPRWIGPRKSVAPAPMRSRRRSRPATPEHRVPRTPTGCALPPSPLVDLNRAVAVPMADGPAAGLAVTDGLLDVAALRNYHLLPSVRGDLLAKLGRFVEARAAFERAAELTSKEAERAHLLARASNS